MQITRDEYREQLFKTAIWQNRNRQSKAIHATDLVYCLRKAWFRLKDYPPSNMVRSEFQVIGATLHQIIQKAFALKEVEITHPTLGVQCHIDVLADAPIEFKTSRKKIKTPNQIPPSYLQQLVLYMTALGAETGYLAVLNVVDASLTMFRLSTTEHELTTALNVFKSRKKALEVALQQNRYAILPKLEWQCPACEYRSHCHG